ncbi:MAG: hypothetical protein IAG13_01725 [Deltaproteobacteria bacterium]|nr:hypothetical protein [Nannocystaceae bacterium]
MNATEGSPFVELSTAEVASSAVVVLVVSGSIEVTTSPPLVELDDVSALVVTAGVVTAGPHASASTIAIPVIGRGDPAIHCNPTTEL